MENGKRNGRQKKDSDKSVQCHIRITEEERRQMEEMCVAQGKSLSDILRNGIRMQYNLHKIRS